MKNYPFNLTLLLFIAAVPWAVTAQTLVEYDIRNLTWDGNPVAAATVGTNAGATSITVTGPAGYDTDFWGGSPENMWLEGWTNTQNMEQNYYEFTISADPGFELNLSNITAGVAREDGATHRGAQTYRLYSNREGFAENDHIAEVSLPPLGSNHIEQATLTAVLGAEYDGIASVTFRVYGFGDINGSGGGGLANFAGNTLPAPYNSFFNFGGSATNVIISGTVDAESTPPTVTTTAAAGIQNTSAQLGGEVTDPGSSAVSARGIVWGLSSDPNINDDHVITMGSGTGVFNGTVPLLPMGTTIHVRAWATNDEGTGYGSNQSFSTFNSASVSLQTPEGFRLLSSPVSVAYNNLLSTIWTQGATGANVTAGSPQVFVWDNTSLTNEHTNWQVVSNLNASITAGTGVLVYVFELDDYEDPGSDDWPKTLSVTGAENAGTITPTINSNNNAWTLLGNPYASHVSYNDLNPTNLFLNTMYIWDPTDDFGDQGGSTGPTDPGAGSWKSWNGTIGDISNGSIAPFQGFFVETGAGTSSVTFSQSSKTTEVGAGFRGKEVDNIYSIRMLLSGERMRNSAWLAFSPRGSLGLGEGDAWKLDPLSANYTLLSTQKEDGAMLDIGHFPIPDKEMEIPLAVESTLTGIFTLSTTDFTLPHGIDLYITDLQEQVSLPLNEDFTYEFTINQPAKAAITDPFQRINNGPMKINATASNHRFLISTSAFENTSAYLPERISLSQNYPNPFNPTTVISFELPVTGDVRLEVFDLTGRQVATLIEGQFQAGSHRVTFDGGNLSSGVYIYRMTAGTQHLTRKLTLIK